MCFQWSNYNETALVQMMTLARTMWQAMITYKDYPVNWLICVTRHQCVNFSWEKIHVYSDENSIEFIMCFWYKATWFHRSPVPCIFYQQHVAKFIAWTLNKIKLALFYRKLLSHHDAPQCMLWLTSVNMLLSGQLISDIKLVFLATKFQLLHR